MKYLHDPALDKPLHQQLLVWVVGAVHLRRLWRASCSPSFQPHCHPRPPLLPWAKNKNKIMPFVFPSTLICQPRTPPPSTVGHSHTHTVNFTLSTNSHYKPLRCSRLDCAVLWPVTVTALYPLPHQGGLQRRSTSCHFVVCTYWFYGQPWQSPRISFSQCFSFSSNFSFRVVSLTFRRLDVVISYNHPYQCVSRLKLKL